MVLLLEKFSITTTKEGNKSFINGESLKLLDELDTHLRAGGTTNEFIPQTTSPTNPTDKTSQSLSNKGSDDKTDKINKQDRQEQQTEQLVIPYLFEQLVNLTIDTIESRRTGLNDLRDLQEIADNNWLLPSS